MPFNDRHISGGWKEMTAKVLPLFLILCLIFIPAASALGEQYTLTNMPLYEKTNHDFTGVYNMTFDATVTGQRIALIQFTIPAESQVDFTIYYGNDSTVSGYSENHHIDLLRTSSTVNIGSSTKTYSYIDTQPFYDFNLAGYAKDTNTTPETTGFLVYSLNYGALDNDLAAFHQVDNIAANTIYRIDASCSKPFDIFVTAAAPADVAGGASKGILDVLWEWINFGISVSGTVMEWAISLFYWLVFIWDNIIMIIALYIAATLAFAARNSRGNMAKFYRQFFADQKKLFEFLLGLWQIFTQIIANIRSLFHI